MGIYKYSTSIAAESLLVVGTNTIAILLYCAEALKNAVLCTDLQLKCHCLLSYLNI